MLWNVQQKRENAMKCSAKEGKCYEMFSKKGKMLWNVQQKRENTMKCSAREGKWYEIFGKKGRGNRWISSTIEWKCFNMFSNKKKMLQYVQLKRENAMKCSAKKGKCYEMFSKKGKMLWNV